jgi:hypothetical protein
MGSCSLQVRDSLFGNRAGPKEEQERQLNALRDQCQALTSEFGAFVASVRAQAWHLPEADKTPCAAGGGGGLQRPLPSLVAKPGKAAFSSGGGQALFKPSAAKKVACLAHVTTNLQVRSPARVCGLD